MKKVLAVEENDGTFYRRFFGQRRALRFSDSKER
jgi:hypothetical protein